MEPRASQTYSLNLIDRSEISTNGRIEAATTARCPHYGMRQTEFGTIAVCQALPILAPIAPSRAQAHCRTSAFSTCPHFVYLLSETQRAQAEAQPAAIAKRWTLTTLRESGWVVGIPATIVLIIVIALLLTQ